MPTRHDTVRKPLPSFGTRLIRVFRDAAPDDSTIEAWTTDPAQAGAEAPRTVRVTSPAYRGVDEPDRQEPLWKAVFEDLWEERELVESILTLTPEELDQALNDSETVIE